MENNDWSNPFLKNYDNWSKNQYYALLIFTNINIRDLLTINLLYCKLLICLVFNSKQKPPNSVQRNSIYRGNTSQVSIFSFL